MKAQLVIVDTTNPALRLAISVEVVADSVMLNVGNEYTAVRDGDTLELAMPVLERE